MTNSFTHSFDKYGWYYVLDSVLGGLGEEST